MHDPTDPVGRLFFNVLAMVAEFEADLIRARTREGLAVAKAKGCLRGCSPSSRKNRKRTWSPFTGQGHATVKLAALFAVARSTDYRAIKRAGDPA